MNTSDTVYVNYLGSLLSIPIALILFAGSIVLQIFLSRAKSKIPGLILPIITFVFSLLVVAFFLLLMYIPQDSSIVGTVVPVAVIGFIPLNIPTVIYLLIYFLSRKKMNDDNNQEIKKMTIQDLE